MIRIVKFIEDNGDVALIKTDAPCGVIENAIAYRNECLCAGNLEDISEFEIVRDFVQDKGYYFDEVADSDEKYYW